MSVQSYESDALAAQYDSTPILIDRLRNWRSTIEYIIQYAENYYSLQKSTTSGFEKIRKGLIDPPAFIGSPTEVNPPAQTEKPPVNSPPSSSFKDAFANLHTKIEFLYKQSDTAAYQIKTTILPNLSSTLAEIDKQYKVLKQDDKKAAKHVDKARDATQKLIERLGRFSSSRDLTSQVDPLDDPYVLKRRIYASLVEQIKRENASAENGLGLQNNFLSFEHYMINTIQSNLEALQHIITQFAQDHVNSFGDITNAFVSIEKDKEWNDFVEKNQKYLVPQENYARNVKNITFSNMNSPGTQPLVEGYLTRRTTVLKNFQTNYYVVTPAGFLQEFKSADADTDPVPELSLYLPHSSLGALPPANSPEFTFKLTAKDSSKKLSLGSHTYVFKAPNYADLKTWYEVIASKCSGEMMSESRYAAPGAAAGGAAAGGVAGGEIARSSSEGTAPVAASPVPQSPVSPTAAAPIAADAGYPAAAPVASPVTSTPAPVASPDLPAREASYPAHVTTTAAPEHVSAPVAPATTTEEVPLDAAVPGAMPSHFAEPTIKQVGADESFIVPSAHPQP